MLVLSVLSSAVIKKEISGNTLRVVMLAKIHLRKPIRTRRLLK